jgi:transposase
MLVVETIAKIRRAYFVHGQPIKAICRDLGVSRKVVRKVIRSEATEFRYEREAQPLPKIGPWSEKLNQLLVSNEGKASRERLTLIRLFEELRGWGYAGGYDAVRRYARRWSKERGGTTAAAYVPLSFAPGEAYQFDWSHEVVLLNGATVTVKAAHVRLCHSRMLFVRAYPRETQEMVFDAHDRAFALFKGTCQRGIYDNMKTAVETILVGKDRLSPLPADVQPLSDRAGRLHAGLRVGERPGREPSRARPRALLHTTAAVQDLRRTERLAARQMHRLRQSASSS